jgi:hypothetical protein
MSDQPATTIPIPTNEEIGRRIISDLLTVPDDLMTAESAQTGRRKLLGDAKEALKDAELQAQINTPLKGSNPEARKLESAAAIANSQEVRDAKRKVVELETAIAAEENAITHLSRRFNATMTLAEYMAARINLTARVQKTPVPAK